MTVLANYTTAEKQLIATLAWFRSRYALFLGFSPERKADRKSLEEFGKIWIGNFKEDWTPAFKSLCDKNVLKAENGDYCFTEYGEQVKLNVDSEAAFYKYEYDNYFQLEKQSRAYAVFCEKVYGKNLSQHGLIDQKELAVLIELLKQQHPAKILDIGCGNGKITEWISEQTHIACNGIDISNEAINYACQRTQGNAQLTFTTGNLNKLQLNESFEAMLFLDTLYYSNNISETLSQAKALLTENGRVYAYFSQWIMDEAYSENLKPANTHLGRALHELKLNYSVVVLTESGLNHWKQKLAVLETMQAEFIEEGSKALWDYRYREAQRYANWGDCKYARYLYQIWQ